MIVLVVIVVWLLAMIVMLGLCRAAAIGDRQMERRSAQWLADKQRERAGDAWERRVLSDLVLGEWDWPE